MANKCKRGQHLMANGECMSKVAITRALKKEAAWGQSCIPETGPERYGLRVYDRGKKLTTVRGGRCVHPETLSAIEQRALFNALYRRRYRK